MARSWNLLTVPLGQALKPDCGPAGSLCSGQQGILKDLEKNQTSTVWPNSFSLSMSATTFSLFILTPQPTPTWLYYLYFFIHTPKEELQLCMRNWQYLWEKTVLFSTLWSARGSKLDFIHLVQHCFLSMERILFVLHMSIFRKTDSGKW